MPADEEGLTSEEQDLFEGLVERIESNKQDVLDVLAGEKESPDEPSPTPTPADGAADPTQHARSETAAADPGDPPAAGGSGEDVSAADVMGDGSVAGDSSDDSTPAAGDSESDGQRPAAAEAAAVADESDASPAGRTGPDSAGESASGAADSPTSTPDAANGGSAPESDADPDGDDPLAGLDERTTVRLTDDVGEIFGVDERTYDLEREDVVTLPEANAAPLVERGAAEELE